MIVLVCLTRPRSSLLSFLLHSRWGGSEAYWWQKRRVLGSIKGLVNHSPKLQEVSIQWRLRQAVMQSGHWGWLGFSSGEVAAEEELSYIGLIVHSVWGLSQGTAELLELRTYVFRLLLHYKTFEPDPSIPPDTAVLCSCCDMFFFCPSHMDVCSDFYWCGHVS